MAVIYTKYEVAFSLDSHLKSRNDRYHFMDFRALSLAGRSRYRIRLARARSNHSIFTRFPVSVSVPNVLRVPVQLGSFRIPRDAQLRRAHAFVHSQGRAERKLVLGGPVGLDFSKSRKTAFFPGKILDSGLVNPICTVTKPGQRLVTTSG